MDAKALVSTHTIIPNGSIRIKKRSFVTVFDENFLSIKSILICRYWHNIIE